MVTPLRLSTTVGLRPHPWNDLHIPPEEHDNWVVGDDPYVSLHLLGAAT